MIPSAIKKEHLLQAIRQVRHNGVPVPRRSRDYCLVYESRHYPPKYIIALAHEVATGRFLPSDEFSGGQESNTFLQSRGFELTACGCGGISTVMEHPTRDFNRVSSTLPSRQTPHSERCSECKVRVRQLLKHIYGTCLPNYRLTWPAQLSAHSATPVFNHLEKVLHGLEGFKGHGHFVKSKSIPPCDFFIPQPGFIVEFDESQHFTAPRKIALSLYPPDSLVGFSVDRWISLCEAHNAKDDDPPYRDEQRAWYDTLRDLLPPLHGLRPTVRLYAGDICWCSLDPAKLEDLETFKGKLTTPPPSTSEADTDRSFGTGQQARKEHKGVFCVSVVFPPLWDGPSIAGRPANIPSSQKPNIPSAAQFGSNPLDLVVFPEAYIQVADEQRLARLSSLARELRAHLLVGGQEPVVRYPDYRNMQNSDKGWERLLLFNPDGSYKKVHTKHSTAGAVAFELSGWNPNANLPVLEINGINVGVTICHDSYLGLLQRHLKNKGAQLWVNPSYHNVVEEKWESIFRLRAVELGIPTLCTLHQNLAPTLTKTLKRRKRRSTHPFAFAPNGQELYGYPPGQQHIARPLSKCREPGIYIVDVPLQGQEARKTPQILPETQRIPYDLPQHDDLQHDDLRIRIERPEGTALVFDGQSWIPIHDSRVVNLRNFSVLVTVLRDDAVFDIAQCFSGLHKAYEKDALPVFWNIWDTLPAVPRQMASILLGRTLESCAPFVLADRRSIYAITELATQEKNLRWFYGGETGRTEAVINLQRAWGLRRSFAMVSKHLVASQGEVLFRNALGRYLSLL